MPVLDPHCPARLKEAFESMEGIVQSFKRSLPYKQGT